MLKVNIIVNFEDVIAGWEENDVIVHLDKIKGNTYSDAPCSLWHNHKAYCLCNYKVLEDKLTRLLQFLYHIYS